MKQLIAYLFILFCIPIYGAYYTPTGGIGQPYLYNPKNNGIESIFIFNTLKDASISFSETAASIVRCYKYTNQTGPTLINSSDITITSDGTTTTYTINNIDDSYGYYAQVDGIDRTAVWIVDYAIHLPQLSSIEPSLEEEQCENLKLIINKQDELKFYTREGTSHNIYRLYNIEYSNYSWDSNSNSYVLKNEIIESADIGSDYVVSAPLADTRFILIGDQFAQYFGMNIRIESSEYKSVAIDGRIISEQINKPEPPPKNDSSFSDSAPLEIRFEAKANEPVATFYTWYIYNTQNMNSPIARYTDPTITYQFDRAGSYRVKLDITDRTSTCTKTYTMDDFEINDYKWEAPRILILGDGKEFKGKYRSIIEFKCSIFNRWGNKVFEWNDPEKGWDGRYKGRYVNPGVYFYVMVAKGADGRKHTESGDINVLLKK